MTSQTGKVLFVRHTAVADQYRDICYGASDVELSPAGEQHAREVADTLAKKPIDRIIHSGLARARFLANHLSKLSGVALEERTILRERDFGDWELETWNDIYQAHGDDMMKMVSEPETYRPGGSETTREFVERVSEGCADLHQPGLTVVVCHGGVIAALTGLAEQLSLAAWLNRIPAHGEIRTLPPVDLAHLDTVLSAGRL